ncbi:MAG TPA: ABC transporter permease subunit [Myxococcaceae bacterium]|nr:ABC transporter permease subunit [Myxococcaceae bacterium]
MEIRGWWSRTRQSWRPSADRRCLITRRSLLWLASLAALIGAYTLAASVLSRPDILPPTREIAAAFGALVGRGLQMPAGGEHQHHHHPSSAQMETLLQEGVTLQGALAVTTGRVLFGLAVGLPLGILLGLLMGWSRPADDYLHPIYILLRSVPPLALITYIMLWLGHSEAHRLIPIVYAVAVTMVIPTYHGVRDVAGKYLVAARALGAKGRLLLLRVILPAAGPAILGGLRYSLAIAWMTAVGAEMLMAENGMGNLLIGGGMWSSRLQTRSDPAVIIVGILALAVAGWAMDAAARILGSRLTHWAR